MLLSKYGIDEINESHALVHDMQKEVKRYQKLLSLAESDRISTIKNNVNYYAWLALLKNAEEYFYNKKNGKKSKTGKDEFDYYTRYIEFEITEKPVKIINFSAEGFEQYCHMIRFTCDKQDYELKIPDINLLNVERLYHMNYGMMTLLFQESECCWGFIGQGYENSDLREAFKKQHRCS